MMSKSRLEAFSDGVIAILITIMVLEFKVPRGADWESVRPLLPIFLTYLLSYVYLGIYWNNHHHMLQAATRVNGKILWANLHLLFWLSTVPFATSWMGQNLFAPVPSALYGVLLLLSAIAYTILQSQIVSHHGAGATLARAVGNDLKGKLSVTLYILAVPLSFVNAGIAYGLYVVVALMWLFPDRRIEAQFSE